MTEDNFSKDANKDFPSICNTYFQRQTTSHSKELVSDNIPPPIEEKESWTSVNKSTLSDKEARRRGSSKRNKVTDKENEVLDRLECLSRSLANLRTDIPDLVSNVILDILKERKKPKRYVEVGYR
jgi:hypothetical protein